MQPRVRTGSLRRALLGVVVVLLVVGGIGLAAVLTADRHARPAAAKAAAADKVPAAAEKAPAAADEAPAGEKARAGGKALALPGAVRSRGGHSLGLGAPRSGRRRGAAGRARACRTWWSP